jgi:SAM-dependent methyltransferase
MHQSSLDKVAAFASWYLDKYRDVPLRILDMGSRVAQPGHASHRPIFAEPRWHYTGVDIEAGENVDLVLADPYAWNEIDDGSFDVVVCGQVFEHVQFFWVTIYEIVRVLRKGGLACIVAPSSGGEHRYPVDCWRFYPDGLAALAEYVRCDPVEVYTQWGDIYLKASNNWHDSALVLQKPRWSDADNAAFLTRNRLSRLLLTQTINKTDLDGLVETSVACAESPIDPCPPGAAFQRLELEILGQSSATARRSRAVRTHLGGIARTLANRQDPGKRV